MSYAEFLESKRVAAPEVGFEVAREDLNPALYPWQADVVLWALRKGRAALFEDTGLGKTLQQLDWARIVHEETGGDVLILAPLAVGHQTVAIAEELGMGGMVRACRDGSEIRRGITVTNYQRLDLFEPSAFAGVVLDESSILKSFGGKTRWKLNRAFASTRYKLCCTATPAPNQHSEIGTHAHFLGVMDHGEMLTRWFTNNTKLARDLRLKAHGEADFWRWVASWAVCISKPSDLRDASGEPYPDEDFVLPPLDVIQRRVAVDHAETQEETGELFRTAGPLSATVLHKEMRRTAYDRAKRAAEIVLEDLSWVGSRSTQSRDGSAPKQIPTTEQSATPREMAKTPSGGESTCAPTTPRIESASPSSVVPKQPSGTPGGESDTRTTQSTARKSELPHEKLRRLIREREEARSSGPPSGSASKNTSGSSPSKARDARSARRTSETVLAEGSPSITATRPGGSAGSSAPTATRDSESSGTTPSDSEKQPNTSNDHEFWVLWCNTDYEQDELETLFGDLAFSIRGSQSADLKERLHAAWLRGERKILICKPSMFGWGLNWQHCSRMAFVGLSYSYEQLYQALRRSWRYGQTKPVEAHLITAETEDGVMQTIRRKQEDHHEMQEKMARAMREGGIGAEAEAKRADVGVPAGRMRVGGGWELREGDCVEAAREFPADSVHLSIFSPPFSSLYSYSPSLRDMGNCNSDEEFFEHFSHLIPELLRITVPGRLCVVHTKDLVRYRNQYGFGGLRAFSDEVRAAFEGEAGIAEDGTRWAFHSRVTIWKDPVREMQRTKSTGLLYKTLRRDSSYSRVGCPEYLMVFRKWTPEADSPEPVTHTKEEFPLEVWQRYASPVWDDIMPTDVLNAAIAREDRDEKHIAPLQLGLIRRCLELWSNPGDLVLDPFAGLGSVGVEALKLGRRFLGVELKDAYFDHAAKNLKRAEGMAGTGTLLDELEREAGA